MTPSMPWHGQSFQGMQLGLLPMKGRAMLHRETQIQVALHILSPLLASGQIPLPQKMTQGAAGWDVCAALEQEVVLEPGSWQAIPTGFALALPDQMECQVRSRSGLARRHGVVCLNAPGTIDSDYRGEVQILLINHGSKPFAIVPGMRIAQLVVAQVLPIEWVQVSQLPATERGIQGFGSTGYLPSNGGPQPTC